MEGVVYDLGGGLVGKAWFDRTAADVLPLQAFLAELNQQDLPFRTPDITVVDSVDGQAVSIERRLTGTPLSEVLASGAMTQQEGLDLFVEMVTALGTTTAGPASKALPLLGQTALEGEWGDGLAELVRRRASASYQYLSADVDDFDELLERVLAKLSALSLDKPQIVHGDICTPNVLVTEGSSARAALLDWGFFTTAGDNTFDAATAAGFYDMYSPAACDFDDQLLDRFEQLGHSRDRMYLYRAAYAIATATIYSPAADGHYVWCVGNLTRKDLRAAL
ncbi:aminoglycoside phosphotransferase family protein [Kribbella sp. NPDC023855]|uniref:phosphotransferase family protein n=1 Tax=Kribbella sp. NPDC023855 TaxID=3154698 RepID=UPI0034031BCF